VIIPQKRVEKKYLLRQIFKDIVFSSAVWWDFWWVFKLFEIELVGGRVVKS